MLQIVWEFHIQPRKRKQFEAHYSSNGTWARLFRKNPGYVATILLQDRKVRDRYLTIDIWKSPSTFRSFKKKFREEYESLDKKCEGLTVEERCLGEFRSVRKGDKGILEMWR